MLVGAGFICHTYLIDVGDSYDLMLEPTLCAFFCAEVFILIYWRTLPLLSVHVSCVVLFTSITR